MGYRAMTDGRTPMLAGVASSGVWQGDCMGTKYYFSTRDLLLIAILSALGGVSSTYVAYIATTLGHVTGIPFSGQLLSGIHVMWLVLIMALVDKKGSGAVAGVTKGFIEFITGSWHGISVIVLSAAEGVFAELGFWPFKKYRTVSYLLAGGLGAWANLLVQQALWNQFGTPDFFALVSVFAFFSGVILAGCLGLGIMNTLYVSSVVKKPVSQRSAKSNLPVIAIVLVLSVVAIAVAAHYLTASNATNDDAGTSASLTMFNVSGRVDHPQVFDLLSFKSQFVTELAGNNDKSGTSRNYTGISVWYVLSQAGVWDNGTRVEFVGTDGYKQSLSMADIKGHDNVLIAYDNGYCLLVVPQSPFFNVWVKKIYRINVH
jgi:energy-coupling factor transport system substrate-specific component